MAGKGLVSEVEQLLLLGVLRLGERAYAVSIHDVIKAQTGLNLPRGTIYVTLDRLEKKGYVESWFSDPTPERGGKAKRYFKVRPAGARALRQTRKALQKMWAGVEPATGRL